MEMGVIESSQGAPFAWSETRTEMGGFVPPLPLVSIIVTHRNSSAHLADALRSVLAQTYPYWECIVVDDCSNAEDREALNSISARFPADRVSVLWLEENVGQIPAVFAGLARTSGHFICVLDPHDRYAPTFLEESVRAHLNEVYYCPILSVDEVFFTEEGIVTGVSSRKTHDALNPGHQRFTLPEAVPPRLTYVPAYHSGWHWTSTSALMFRRAAFHYLKPVKTLPYKNSADSYLATGAHRIGGTLFLSKQLVYRGVHASNGYLAETILWLGQNRAKDDGGDLAKACAADAVEAIVANGGAHHLPSHMRPKPTSEMKPKAGSWTSAPPTPKLEDLLKLKIDEQTKPWKPEKRMDRLLRKLRRLPNRLAAAVQRKSGS